MTIDPEARYRQFGHLIATFPKDLVGPGPLSSATFIWLAQVSALLGTFSLSADQALFTSAVDHLMNVNRDSNAHQIAAIAYRGLAKAELAAPTAVQGAFIPVASPFDVFQAINKIFQTATMDIVVIDPYMDEKVLTNFAGLAGETVTLRLLSDSRSAKKISLQPAITRWRSQHPTARQVEVRLTGAGALHDRLFLIDSKKVGAFTQSLEDMATRSPAC